MEDNILEFLFEAHKDFLCLNSDIAGVSISDSAWSRVRSYLSPENKFVVIESIMMTDSLISQVKIKLTNSVIFKKRKVIKLYVSYDFPGFENGACFEFLLRGASLDTKQVMCQEEVIHQIRRSATDQNKIFGIISVGAIENMKSDDTSLYERLLKTL
jgi:hypothetical protein